MAIIINGYNLVVEASKVESQTGPEDRDLVSEIGEFFFHEIKRMVKFFWKVSCKSCAALFHRSESHTVAVRRMRASFIVYDSSCRPMISSCRPMISVLS